MDPLQLHYSSAVPGAQDFGLFVRSAEDQVLIQYICVHKIPNQLGGFLTFLTGGALFILRPFMTLKNDVLEIMAILSGLCFS
ncbi:hypothetical protein FKM82_004652 [Ascaphus truei]